MRHLHHKSRLYLLSVQAPDLKKNYCRNCTRIIWSTPEIRVAPKLGKTMNLRTILPATWCAPKVQVPKVRLSLNPQVKLHQISTKKPEHLP